MIGPEFSQLFQPRTILTGGHPMAHGRNWLLFVSLAVLLTWLSPALSSSSPDTAAGRFAKLKADYDADMKAMTEALKAAKADQPARYVITGRIHPNLYLPTLLELGRSDDEATACAALTLAVLGWPDDKRA